MAANRFKVVEEEPVRSVTTESISVAAPVETSQEERIVAHRSLPAIVVPFFVVIAIAIGMVFYVHYEHTRGQAEFAKQYAAENAWRPLATSGYTVVEPYLIDLEQIDPAKKQDWTHIMAIDAKRQAAEDSLYALLLRSNTESARLTLRSARTVFDIYDKDLTLARLPVTLRADASDKLVARELIVTDIATKMRIGHNYRSGKEAADDIRQTEREARDMVMQMSDDELASHITAILKRKSLWGEARIIRKALASEISTTPPMPPTRIGSIF